MAFIEEFERENKKLQNLNDAWTTNRRELIDELEKIANEIHKDSKNTRISRLAGCSASIVGSALIITGAVAAPLTMGASLGLTIAGGVLAGSGTATAAGASLTNYFLRKTNVKRVEELVKQDEKRTEELRIQYGKVETVAQELHKDSKFFAGKNGFQFVGAPGMAGWKVGSQLSKIPGPEEIAFKIFGTATKVVLIGAIALCIVVDIWTLVADSIKVHKNSVNEVVEDIRELAEKMTVDMVQVGSLVRETSMCLAGKHFERRPVRF